MRRRSFVASLAAAVLALGVVTAAALATANGDPELGDLASPTIIDETPSDDLQLLVGVPLGDGVVFGVFGFDDGVGFGFGGGAGGGHLWCDDGPVSVKKWVGPSADFS